MALETSNFDVMFRGLSEHSDPKTQIPGALDTCENAVFTKAGQIRKRRGYAVVELSADTEGDDIDPSNVLMNGASIGHQLVIVGYDSIYSLATRTGAVGGGVGQLIPRGPTFRGNVHVFNVSTASLSD